MAIKRGIGSASGHIKHRSRNSGYLRSGPGYFPSDAPTWFSYTLDFAMGGHYYNMGMVKVGRTAEKKLSGDRMSYHRGILDDPNIKIHLKALADTAKQSELAFLNKYNINLPNNDWGGLIQAFTLLFSSQAAMEQNLKMIEQLYFKNSGIKDNRYIYFVTHFGSNVQTAARSLIRSRLSINSTINDIDKLLDDIIELALQKTFEQRVYVDNNGIIHTNDVKKADKENMKIQQAYINFKKEIDKFKNNPYFKNTILELLGVDKDFINETIKAQKRHKKQPKVKDAYRDGNIKGAIGEAFEYTFAQIATENLKGQIGNSNLSLDWLTLLTGNKGVKADIISHNIRVGKELANIEGLMSQSGEDNSKRVNTIQKYREWFQQMKDAYGEIMFISDKNYQLKTGFSGFTAQDHVTLRNLGALLSEVGAMGSYNIRNLLDYLSNCGGDMLLGRAEEGIMDSIAVQIGNFLFDDLEITGAVNINRIHLLNLSGFYIPLSVYFEGLISAIDSARAEMNGYVHVSFHPSGADGAASPWSGKEDFYKFRNKQLDESYVDVSFMRNFTAFITQRVNFSL